MHVLQLIWIIKSAIKSKNPEPLAGCWLLNIYSTAWCLQGVTFPARSAGLSTLLQQSRAYAFCYSEPNSQHCQHEQHLMVFFAWYIYFLYISSILPPSIKDDVGWWWCMDVVSVSDHKSMPHALTDRYKMVLCTKSGAAISEAYYRKQRTGKCQGLRGL